MRTLAVLALLSLAGTAQAETRFLAGIGYNHGGDSLASVRFIDGSIESIRAGSGLGLNLGAVHHLHGVPFSLQASAGYLVESTSASNSDARFSRYPIELLGFWRREKHRLGGGLAYHLSPTLNMDNLGGSLDFENSAGVIVEYGYGMFSFRYTAIDYSPKGFSGEADGDSFGIYVSSGF